MDCNLTFGSPPLFIACDADVAVIGDGLTKKNITAGQRRSSVFPQPAQGQMAFRHPMTTGILEHSVADTDQGAPGHKEQLPRSVARDGKQRLGSPINNTPRLPTITEVYTQVLCDRAICSPGLLDTGMRHRISLCWRT